MKVFTWGMKLLTLITVNLLLQGWHGVGAAGVIFVCLVAVVWDVCTYVEVKEERK